MPVSDAKRRNNDNYNAKCDAIILRPRKEAGRRIRAAAAERGESLQGYILEAVRLRMERDAARSAAVSAENAAAARLAAPPVRRPAAIPTEEQSAALRRISDPERRKAAMIAALRGD